MMLLWGGVTADMLTVFTDSNPPVYLQTQTVPPGYLHCTANFAGVHMQMTIQARQEQSC